jgi:hypothetical protein
MSLTSVVRCLGMLVTLCVIVVTTVCAQPGPPAPNAETRKPIVRRTMQPDGSARIEYADGTVQVLPKLVEVAPLPPVPPTSSVDPAVGGQRGKAQLPMPAVPHPMTSDAKTLERYSQAVNQYYEYQISGFKHRQRVFQWQLSSSRIIFAVVLVVVFAGILFAAAQFYLGVRTRVAKQAALPTQVTEFEASLKGIKVSSPVLGVVILAISLGFFYLYLVYVYPISEIF